MSTTAEADRLSLLVHLVRVEFDAVAAYTLAIARFDDPTAAAELRVLREEHEQRILRLCEAILQRGGVPPRRGEGQPLLTQGRAALDRAQSTPDLLRAIRTYARQILAAWRQASLGWSGVGPPEITETLRLGVQDAQRHLAWLDTQLR